MSNKFESLFRDDLMLKLRAEGIGSYKVSSGIILSNLMSLRIDICIAQKAFVSIKFIQTANFYGNRDDFVLSFMSGNLYNPNTRLNTLSDRVVGAILKFKEFCELSDNFVLPKPTVVGSKAKAVIRKIIKKHLSANYKANKPLFEKAITRIYRVSGIDVYDDDTTSLRDEYIVESSKKIVKSLASKATND